MKLINIRTRASREAVLSALENGERVNERVKFDDKRGKPVFRLKRGKRGVKISCEYVGGPTKDNGFIVGTYFSGRVYEKNGVTVVKGIVTTAPIYHLALFLFGIYYVYRCISLGGFNPVPVILFLFSIFLFKDEFKKQGLISRFIKRAVAYAEKNL